MPDPSDHNDKFDLAIVLVHGIGNQEPGDTLERALKAFHSWFEHVSYNSRAQGASSHRLSASIVSVLERGASAEEAAEAVLEVKLVVADNSFETEETTTEPAEPPQAAAGLAPC